MEKISWSDRVKGEVLQESRKKEISYLQQKEGSLTVLITTCPAF